MNNETMDLQEISFEIKKLINDIDNVKMDIDLYGEFVDEKVMVE